VLSWRRVQLPLRPAAGRALRTDDHINGSGLEAFGGDLNLILAERDSLEFKTAGLIGRRRLLSVTRTTQLNSRTYNGGAGLSWTTPVIEERPEAD